MARAVKATLKSLARGRGAKTAFVSVDIPIHVRERIAHELKAAQGVEQVRAIFNVWMAGEASTPAAPFPLTGWTGKALPTRDDPFRPVKLAAEQELQAELDAYFADLAERIAREVDGKKHLAGMHNQSAHGGKGSSSIPNTASPMDVIDHFSKNYNVYPDHAPGKAPTVKEAQQIDVILGNLPEKFVKNNRLFTEMEVLDDDPKFPDTAGVHFGNRITLYRRAFGDKPPWSNTKRGSFLDETLTHEIGESLWKQASPQFQSAFTNTASIYMKSGRLMRQPPNEQFAIWFSRYQVGDFVPQKIQKFLE